MSARWRGGLLVVLSVTTACATLRPPDRDGWARDARARERDEELARGAEPPGLWFSAQRMADGVDPERARAAALASIKQRGALPESPGSWYSEGPFNVGGRVTSLAVDPNDPAHLWLGAAAGGVFTSTNGGADWTPVFDDYLALAIGSIAAHPTDSNILYVGTGEESGANHYYEGDGVYKTTDGGQTWTNLGLAETKRIGRIAIDPSNPQRVFVAAGGSVFHPDEHRGVYRSLDGGASWEQVLFVAANAGAVDLAIDPVTPNRIFAAIWERHAYGGDWRIGGPNSGVYRSTDGGSNWTRMPLPIDTGRIGVAIAPSNPSIVYALVTQSGGGGLLGVYKTTNGGNTWAKVSTASQSSLFAPYTWYFGNIRVDPTNANIVYVLDVSYLKSVNGGVTFAAQDYAPHADGHDLILKAGGRMLTATDGGFNVSTDGGATWSTDQNLPITQFYDIGVDPLQPEIRFGAAQDNGIDRTTTGGTHDWAVVFWADGVQVEVDPTNSARVYGSWQNGQLLRSSDGGDTWTEATDGITGRSNWRSPLAVDPATAAVYTGRQVVFRSTDFAASWAPVSPDLTNGMGSSGNLIRGTITVVRVSSVDPRIVWAGTDDGNVWVSSDAAASWTQVNPPGLGYWVTAIAPDPFDARTAYLSVSGFRLDTRLPYFRVTHDLGATWEDRSAGLPQVPISAVLADTDWRGRIFVGGDLGVQRSDDGGLTWSDMRTGLPYAVVLDLQREDLYDTLFAGTYGRSMFSFWLPQLPAADGDADGVDNNHDCALADPGAFAIPGEVPALAVGRDALGSAILTWPSLSGAAGPATVYDVAAGSVAGLASGGTSGSAALACGLPAATVSDPAMPVVGSGRYYLVRARNACGMGGWGSGSAGARASGACP